MGIIKGVGIDIAEISRIEKLVNNYQGHFLEKVYTPDEINYCGKMASPALHFAGRWAAKEAFYKALSAQSQKHSSWKSIEIIPGENGKPYIHVCSGKLMQYLENEEITQFHLSISHEKNYCIANVVLE